MKSNRETERGKKERKRRQRSSCSITQRSQHHEQESIIPRQARHPESTSTIVKK